jgi:peptidoglycan/xylan/chitin deacetylase (PgdA/CDA1 family)
MNISDYINRLEGEKLTIFLFHGVIRHNPFKIRNYNRKHILDSEFSELLGGLVEYGTPFSVDELVRGVPVPPRSFIISFDDGFENNYSVAAPILDEFKIPAVFYITSNFVDKNMMSWIDRIDFALEETHQQTLNLSFFDKPISVATNEQKKDLLIKIRNLAKGNKEFFIKKEMHISEIFEACGIKEVFSCDSSIDLKMTWKQVGELDSNSLFTIGGHTHTHPIMSYLKASELDYEITTCLEFLEVAGVKNLNHFSYPEGLGHCYNEDVIDILKQKNITCCPTAIDGVNSANTDLFHLKRVTVV